MFHDVGVVDAATYAAMLSQGRPEYAGPWGMNTDPATVGFFVFCVIAWVLMLGALAVAISPLWIWWRVRERRARACWWADYQRETAELAPPRRSVGCAAGMGWHRRITTSAAALVQRLRT